MNRCFMPPILTKHEIHTFHARSMWLGSVASKLNTAFRDSFENARLCGYGVTTYQKCDPYENEHARFQSALE